MPVHDESTPEQRARHATAALDAAGFGPVDWVAEAGSTNADLLDQARAGARHGRILVADYQSAGKGRRGRTWTAAPGDALLASVLFRPADIPADHLSVLTSALAISATEACRTAGFAAVEIKWPNDLVVAESGSHRKLAGILAESTLHRGEAAVVVGFGLNIVGDRLGELEGRAVALGDLGPMPDRTDLLISIVERLASWLEVGEGSGRAALWARYRELSAIIGRRVRVNLDGAVIEGVAADVSETGALLVDAADGRHEVVVGDVVALRAT